MRVEWFHFFEKGSFRIGVVDVYRRGGVFHHYMFLADLKVKDDNHDTPSAQIRTCTERAALRQLAPVLPSGHNARRKRFCRANVFHLELYLDFGGSWTEEIAECRIELVLGSFGRRAQRREPG